MKDPTEKRSGGRILKICTAVLLLALLAGCTGTSSRTAGAEEADFFRELVRRNGGEWTAEDLDEAAIQCVNEYSALTQLGAELGLCEPYSFEQLKQDLTQENEDRARKSQTGEVFYGPESLSLDSYFQYFRSALQADIMTVLLDQRDEELISEARGYYDQNREIFTRIASVTCRITQNGTTRERTIPRTEFRTLGQSDPMLMDFLATAGDGEQTVLGEGETARRVQRLGVTTELLDFGYYEREIVEVYLSQEWLPTQLEKRIQKNPIVF